jgi:hypothetical protein
MDIMRTTEAANEEILARMRELVFGYAYLKSSPKRELRVSSAGRADSVQYWCSLAGP